MFTVVESFVRAKSGSPASSEDGIVVTDDFVAVIDGATDPFGGRTCGPSPGRIAMELVADAIRRLPAGCDRWGMAALLTEHVRLHLPGDYEGSAAAAVSVYCRARREVWRIGDTRFWWHGRSATEPSKAIDAVTSEFRAALLTSRIASGTSLDELRAHDIGRKAVLPLIRAQIEFRNVLGEWGYGAVDGTPVPADFVEGYPVPGDATEVVLHTDGYPRSCPSLAEAEAHLRAAVAADPLCIGELRGTKGVLPGRESYDDRAYVRIVP